MNENLTVPEPAGETTTTYENAEGGFPITEMI
jgi:hypothetical protein